MQKNWKAEDRRRLLLCLVIFGLMAALFILPNQFSSSAGGKQVRKGLFQQTKSHEEGLDNYDIRDDAKNTEVAEAFAKYRQTAGKDAAVVADIRGDFVRGEEEFKSRFPTAKVEYNSDIRTPEVITPDVFRDKVERLSQPSSLKRSEILRNFVKENNALIGVSDAQADSLKVTADYTNPNGYMSFAHLEQFINDVPVFRGEVKAGFTKSGEMIRVINNLAPGLDYESLSTEFHNPLDAVKAAFRNINREPAQVDITRNDAVSTDLKTVFGEGDWATTAEKMYFPTEPGIAVPAWRVTVWLPVNAYMIIVDAESGRLLWRKNATNDQTQSATYQIYRNTNSFLGAHDNPAPLSPGPTGPVITTQGTLLTRSNHTLIGNEAPYAFNNLGWITDGANVTDGNNVEAGVDRVTPNGVDAPQTGSPNRVFDSTWNPPPGSPTPGDDPLTAQAQRGAVIQMFYVMNRYHDELYRVGFTEPARNFQNDNFGRGGVGADRISAEGQDSGGFNNANFSIVADGARGRMQMYLWNGPTPDYDGTTDAEVIIHEVTHGTSQRLHGNASGLSANMSGGMGEGWGDWYAYTMLAEPSDPINGVYTTGGYATFSLGGMQSNYYHGIRRFPRAPITFTGGPNNKPHNPFTFKHLNGNCDTTLGTTAAAVDSAFPRNPVVSTSSATQACNQVHNGGEVWSSMLWEIRNRMVSRLGFTDGTTRVLQVVTDGMKLAPLNPTFLQERDAIIAAATALPSIPEASADVFDVREGFRVRGMGFSASIQNANTGGTANATAVTEAFDVPNAIITNPISLSDSTGDGDGFAEPGENILISVPITNSSGSGVINNVTGMITGGGSADYGNIADGATVTRQITYTVPGDAICGSEHTVTITGTSSLGALNPRTFTFRLGAPVGGAPVSFTGGAIANPGAGTIGNAAPYPSTINVSGLTGGKKIKLELTGLNTTYPGDMDWLLVGPGGQKFVVMSDALSSFTTQTAANVVFTDSAAAIIPATGSTNLNGEWKPTDHNVTPADNFPAPAPASPWSSPAPTGSATFASVFGTAGTAMNGTWSLYGVDDVSGDVATITGWKLTFEANDFVCDLNPPVNSAESRADFDGDGKTDISVYRPSEGNWYLNQSMVGFGVINWGISTDTLVPGDYDGDDKADLAVFRPNADSSQPDFYVLNSNGFTVSGVSWGLTGDIPVINDYDGDDKEDIAVFRPSNNTWYILKSGGGATFTTFGQAGDVPVSGDFDGDFKGDLVVYRSGTWIGQFSGGGAFNVPFGSAGDILVPADYNDDDKDDLAVYRPSTGQWIYQPSGGGATVFISWGNSTDIPVPGDYDGDGADDPAIYRNGTWWILRSTAGAVTTNFGIATDKAIPRSYIP
jgi:hypothetical protein